MVVCFKPTGAVPPPEGTPTADLDQHGGGTPSHYFVLLREQGEFGPTFSKGWVEQNRFFFHEVSAKPVQ